MGNNGFESSSSYDDIHDTDTNNSDTVSYTQDDDTPSWASVADNTHSDTASTSTSPVHHPPTSQHRLANLSAPIQNTLTDSSIPFRARSSYQHATWARTFHSRPELFIQPQSVEEVQKIVCLAHRCRRRVQTIGSGHSPSDLTCTSAWMVNLTDLSRILIVDKDEHGNGGTVLVQAGISLGELNRKMQQHGLTVPNLGSIDVQSIAGAISTATHGSSTRHGLLSQYVRGLRIVLADGHAVWCDGQLQSDLFRAALVSLGAIGIITEVELQMSPSTDIEWEQRLVRLDYVLNSWERELWTQAEYVRCWWLPYAQRAIIWKADKTTKPRRSPKASWYGGVLGFHTYHILLWAANYFPRILPTVEWFVFGMQYGFRPGSISSGVAEQRTGLLMDCLYSQFVNEWALPLHKGPEALTRLSKWLNGDEQGSRIPFSSKGLYVHSPIEVRATDNSSSGTATHLRGFMDPTVADGPTLYLNATLYRPYGKDPPCRERYYEAFEWLMKELGGRPHWAKNFATVTHAQLMKMYGEDMKGFLKVREEVDADGMFVGAWQRRYLLGEEAPVGNLEEQEVSRTKMIIGGGLEWTGEQALHSYGASLVVKSRVGTLGNEDFELVEADDELVLKR